MSCELLSAATSVTIGLQMTSYSVYETDEYLVVCAEVLSGDLAGRTINIDYITTSDTAEGGYIRRLHIIVMRNNHIHK